MTPPIERLPAALLPYQQRWVADSSAVKVYEKSRRIGVSWATAAEASLVAAAERKAGGMDVFYVGYNREMAEEFVGDAGAWARHYGHAATAVGEEIWEDGDEKILTYVIRFASGFKIQALSSRPSNLRGRQGYAVFDEAAFHEQLGELLKAGLAFLMWGGRVAVISTHDGAENDFNELVQSVREKRKPYTLHRTTLDEAIGEGLYRRMCMVRGIEWSAEAEAAWRTELYDFYGDDADEELGCVPKRSGGAYLASALIDVRMYEAPVFRFTVKAAFAELDDVSRTLEALTWCREVLEPALAALPRDRRHFFGEDFGRVSDLTVIAPGTQEQTLRLRVPFLAELRRVPFRQQEQILFYVVDRLPRFTAGALDATGNGMYLAEVAAQRYGFGRIDQVKLTDSWYAENLPPFKAALDDGLLWIPRDADVRDDLRALQVIDGTPKLPKAKNRKTADGEPRHGDAAIALVLAHHASRMEVRVYDYRSVETRDLRTGAAEGLTSRPTHRDPGHTVKTDRAGFGRMKGGVL